MLTDLSMTPSKVSCKGSTTLALLYSNQIGDQSKINQLMISFLVFIKLMFSSNAIFIPQSNYQASYMVSPPHYGIRNVSFMSPVSSTLQLITS